MNQREKEEWIYFYKINPTVTRLPLLLQCFQVTFYWGTQTPTPFATHPKMISFNQSAFVNKDSWLMSISKSEFHCGFSTMREQLKKKEKETTFPHVIPLTQMESVSLWTKTQRISHLIALKYWNVCTEIRTATRCSPYSLAQKASGEGILKALKLCC